MSAQINTGEDSDAEIEAVFRGIFADLSKLVSANSQNTKSRMKERIQSNIEKAEAQLKAQLAILEESDE